MRFSKRKLTQCASHTSCSTQRRLRTFILGAAIFNVTPFFLSIFATFTILLIILITRIAQCTQLRLEIFLSIYNQLLGWFFYKSTIQIPIGYFIPINRNKRYSNIMRRNEVIITCVQNNNVLFSFQGNNWHIQIIMYEKLTYIFGASAATGSGLGSSVSGVTFAGGTFDTEKWTKLWVS